jgi:hypothetical protein
MALAAVAGKPHGNLHHQQQQQQQQGFCKPRPAAILPSSS